MTTPRFRALLENVRAVVSLSSHDANTDSGRSRERYRRVALAGAASMVAKAVQAATTLITVPLLLHYLGEERYGVWMTITSVVALLGVVDLGIGNSLLNQITARAEGDRAAVRRILSSASALLWVIAALVLLAAVLFERWVPLQTVFGIRSPMAANELRATWLAVIGCFALSLPLDVVQRVHGGFQEMFIPNLWQGAASVLSLVAAVLCVRWHAGLAWVALTAGLAPVAAAGLNGAMLFGKSRPWLRPEPLRASIEDAWALGRSGAAFLMLQLGTLIVVSSPNLFVARFVGAEAVASYSIASRPILFFTMLSIVWVQPLWPAYGDAFARGDRAWIARTLRRTTGFALVPSLAIAILYFVFHRKILALWVGKVAVPDPWTMAALCGFLPAHAVRWTTSICLNGCGQLRAQIPVQLGVAIAAPLAAVLLGAPFGLPGVALPFAAAEWTVAILLWRVATRFVGPPGSSRFNG